MSFAFVINLSWPAETKYVNPATTNVKSANEPIRSNSWFITFKISLPTPPSTITFLFFSLSVLRYFVTEKGFIEDPCGVGVVSVLVAGAVPVLVLEGSNALSDAGGC